MGLCFSCGKSKARFRDKSTKICGHIQSAVSPLHVSHEEPQAGQLNGHLPTLPPLLTVVCASPRLVRRRSMANSFPNMNITNPIKGLVSKRRNRYKQDGFNLDLTYITNNIIAMGYPASNIEGVYRNHIDDVVKLLDSKHKDHYYIYNLCSERSYDTSKFHNRVRIFPFDDHNPPKIELIKPFCTDVEEWLTKHPLNVAVVHCKAGKGRTGTMICCYLLHSKKFATAEEALSFYGQTRTQDRKGVTIPSQLRYVSYYSRMVRENLEYVPVSVYIKEIILEPVPCFAGGQGSMCFSISQQTLTQDGEHLYQKCKKLYKSGVYEIKKGASNYIITFDCCFPLTGDIKIEFYNKSKIRKEKQLQFWFNTFFVDEELSDNSNGFIEHNGSGARGVHEKTYVLSFNKSELDIVNKKDKQNKVFSADFKVTLLLHRIPTNNTGQWLREASTLPQDTPSESSEAESSEEDTNEEDDWDSGECPLLFASKADEDDRNVIAQ